MKNNITELVFILDRSGSMAGLESDTVGGFNAMIEKQKKQDGQCWVSTVLFANESKVIHDRVRLEEIRPMTEDDYTVGGCTALIDAIGEAIHHIANIHKYARAEDVPAHTVFVITTDGMENASRRWTYRDVQKLVKHQQEKCGWEFLFLGANMDAISAARSFGIREDRAVRYECDGVGTGLNFAVVSQTIGRLRKGEAIGSAWSAPIRADYDRRGRK